LSSIAPVIPGLARGIQGKSTSIPRGVTYIYCVVWPFGVVVSSLVYYLSNVLFPRKMVPASEVEEVHATYPTESGLDMDDEKKI
jgi:cytosine/uracil/thiamine/allantoin permease